jgi:trans-2,3-dihydro-3-hydroxyanthranilate isomerase
VLARRGELDRTEVVQHCGAGAVKVTVDGDEAQLTATPRDLVGPLSDRVVDELLADLGLGAADRAGDAWLAGAGLTFVHLPVTEEAVARARVPLRPVSEYPGIPATTDLLEAVNLVAIDGTAVHSRVFVPGLSVPEDPATGSAAAGLGMVLAASGRLPDGGGYTIRQGAELGRPSRLAGHVEASAGVPTACHVRGQVHPVAHGSLRVPPP